MAGRNILIALDEGPVSKEALEWALNNKLILKDDKIRLLTILDPANGPTMISYSGGIPMEIQTECKPDAEQLKSRKTMLENYEKLVKAEMGKNMEVKSCTVVSCTGSSTEHGRHICEFAAREKSDMIIIGSRGMGSMSKKILGLFGLGSVSSFVVDHSTAPNVVIHKFTG